MVNRGVLCWEKEGVFGSLYISGKVCKTMVTPLGLISASMQTNKPDWQSDSYHLTTALKVHLLDSAEYQNSQISVKGLFSGFHIFIWESMACIVGSRGASQLGGTF